MVALNVLSFDIEEHHRIEAAASVTCSPEQKAAYATRMEHATRRILDQLAAAGVKATFFIVGEIARTHPALVRAIHEAGHEVGSHSWNHQRIHRFDPEGFREDLRKSKDALEQATGEAVRGFRAPTFSLVKATGWAVDVLAECGFEYDSSIFPVRHDRYGIASAPRVPFRARGKNAEILELPPLTYRLSGMNLPVAGGGYFRLFPLAFMRAGLAQANHAAAAPNVAMLYFHPWEFDPDQPRLPLRRFARWRTYVGMNRTTARLGSLLRTYTFVRAIDAVQAIRSSSAPLPEFQVAE